MTAATGALAGVILIAALSAGCAWSVPQPSLIREPRREVVPLRIGVHYPPELRGFTYRHHFTDTAWVLGKPSVQLLSDALGLLFGEVVEVPRRPSDADPARDVAGVIEARITSAGFRYPRPGERAIPTEITYAFTLYAPGGAPVASWTVSGAGAEPIDNPLGAVGALKRSFERAMREAAWKLTSEFRDVEDVRRWLAAQGVR
jgi:hypothetical protein